MSKFKKTILVVAAALVDKQGRVLIAQRPEGKSMAGLWEFPGGKINEGETPEDALVRELSEELGVQIKSENFTPVAFASHAYDDFHLLMPLFLCRTWQGAPVLFEHTALEWVAPADLDKYDMPPADIPLVKALKDLLK